MKKIRRMLALLLAAALFAGATAAAGEGAEPAESTPLGGVTEPVDSSTALADGAYQPDSFSFSGGTGRVTISCPEVTVKHGKVTATVAFSSTRIGYVKASGQTYYPTVNSESSSFEIPVQLNANNRIIAMTTAMSQEHEVEYSIYIHLAAAQEGEAAQDTSPAPGLTWQSRMELKYATGFSVDYYEGGYALIDIVDGGRYLLVPEGKEPPAGLDVDIVALQQPLNSIYLAATSAMALFDALDALDSVRLSSVRASGWYVENAASAMEAGDMLYGGKYSEPDYELLINEGCDLAIESTMIYHSPKVKEMIELLGIPVLVERASYEPHPLGRTEWIRLYGALLGREAEAEAFMQAQEEAMTELEGFENTEKTVAFFYVSSDGSAVVRTATDYVPKMIELAGGRYLFDDLSDGDGARSTLSITMEEFYAAAVDADYLVYNATIDDPLTDVAGLLAKSPLFADFKAVREGNVFCTGKYLYQATDIVADTILDFHRMLTGREDEMTFLYELN